VADVKNSPVVEFSGPGRRERQAQELVAELFRGEGWKVVSAPNLANRRHADLLVSRQRTSYVVEIKVAAEGRSDRLVPLWAQAALQAGRAAGDRHTPLAVIAAPEVSARAADAVLAFAEEQAPEVGLGVVDLKGFRRFRGEGLEGLSAESAGSSRRVAAQPVGQALFSDLNQWMLKVLLAPELPDTLLSAPRGRYRNASQLAAATNVSVMSAFRFVRQLQLEGHLEEAAPYLSVVRREELFSRWQVASSGRVEEVPMRFLLGGGTPSQLRRLLSGERACLGLFAAADALGLGLVSGVPRHVYLPRLTVANEVAWRNVRPVGPGEQPDFILRRARAAQSVFRGAVRPNGVAASDVLQVWLDVSGHPARGREQAAHIRRRVLEPLISGKRARG
jgi:hypothetical protein